MTTLSHRVTGAIGLPTVEGTSYVAVTGDGREADCNAYTPLATGSGISARYQASGFPS